MPKEKTTREKLNEFARAAIESERVIPSAEEMMATAIEAMQGIEALAASVDHVSVHPDDFDRLRRDAEQSVGLAPHLLGLGIRTDQNIERGHFSIRDKDGNEISAGYLGGTPCQE